MENATYAGITRQHGLMSEMRAIANNIANASTTGFKAEGIMFSEHVKRLGEDHASLSMATAEVRQTVHSQGGLSQTNGTFDLAIEGDGFFQIATPNGDRLTRAGAFTPNGNGDLVTADGYQVLDAGGAPVFVPQGTSPVGIAPDGTISVDGQPIGQIALVSPENTDELIRSGGMLFEAPNGFDTVQDGRMLQGFLEDSNVNAITQIGRMIEVQRAYELGQSFMDKEDERIRGVIQAISR